MFCFLLLSVRWSATNVRFARHAGSPTAFLLSVLPVSFYSGDAPLCRVHLLLLCKVCNGGGRQLITDISSTISLALLWTTDKFRFLTNLENPRERHNLKLLCLFYRRSR